VGELNSGSIPAKVAFTLLPTLSAQVLSVQPRISMGHGVKALRRSGAIPANIFGHGASLAIQIDNGDLRRWQAHNRLVGVLNLAIAEQNPIMVLVHRVTISPRDGTVQHVDFFRLAHNELVHTHVPLQFVGESSIARANQAAVIPLLESIAITGLPHHLPAMVEVDMSRLTRLDTVLHARDIQLPPGITLNISPDEPIAKIQTQRGESITSTSTTDAPSTD
jgi:large subunit ribosomal protein L25